MPQPRRTSYTRAFWTRRVAATATLAAALAAAMPIDPALAVTKTTLWSVISATSTNYKTARTTWYTFPSADRLRWSAATSSAGAKLAAVRTKLSAATTQTQIDAVAKLVYTERTRSKVLLTSTTLAGTSFSARKAAVTAGQNGFTSWLNGGSDATWTELRSDSAAVAALAAADRRRAWASLGTTTAPSASQAQAALGSLTSSSRATAPAGWVGVPGGCAVPAATSSWLGTAGQAGRHLWTDEATIADAQTRSTSGGLAQSAHTSLMQEAANLEAQPLPSDLAAVYTPLQKRSQRIGYATLMGDSSAASYLRSDLTTVLPPGPKAGNALRDAMSLEALATDLDWTGLDEATDTRSVQWHEALLVRWLGPLSCRFDDLEATVVDPDNITIIVDTGFLHAAYTLAPTEPTIAAALIRTALLHLVPGLTAMTSDGGSYEGPSYWNLQARALAAVYGTTRAVYGTSPPLTLPSPGSAPSYAWNSTTPNGNSLAFSDAKVAPETLRPGLVAWMAHLTGDARAGALARQYLQNPTEGFQVLWWPTDAALSASTPARVSTLFRRTGLAALHAGSITAWLKGGNSKDTHTHLDLGSVGYDKDGIQWAVDPGEDDYSLPGYSSRAVDSLRWTYWKVAAKGHTTLHPATGQPPLKTVTYTGWSAGSGTGIGGAGVARLDLRSVMPGSTAATRTCALSTSGVLTVSDRVTSSLARSWSWSWITDAAVSISGSGSSRTFTLSRSGHTVHIRLTGLPAGSTASVVTGPSTAKGPDGGQLQAITVTLGKTTSLALNATIS